MLVTICSCAEARISSCGGGGGGGGGTVVKFTPTVLVTMCCCAEASISSGENPCLTQGTSPKYLSPEYFTS